MATEIQTMEGLPDEVRRTLFFRQVGFLVAIAASVAVGVYVMMWSQTPNYSLLYGSLSSQDIGQVLDSLSKANIPYRVDETSGAVLVPSAKVHEARIKLAGEGLPKSANAGYGMLNEEQGLGTSQFIERARYHHALETELARSIATIKSVRSARVHIAMPKQSVFTRERKPVSASVLVDLYAGHRMTQENIAAISNMVAASVPNLDISNVNIVDQNGRLMTQGESARALALTASQFQYASQVEESYMRRIENILEPIVGQDRVRAQVTADFDFTSTEQTRESFNPDTPAVRSEQLEEESMNSDGALLGVPGALSNQPPAEGAAPEVAEGEPGAAGDAESQSSTQRRTVRNYEIDKTISHTRKPVGDLQRLSVAVVIDHKRQVGADGAVTRVEHSPEEIERFTSLVREAIGYDPVRGDTVNVINAEFATPEVPEPLPEVPIYMQPWVWDISKQVLGGLFVLFLVFGVLKPSIKNMVDKEITLTQSAYATATAGADGSVAALSPPDGEAGGQVNGDSMEAEQQALAPPSEYDKSIDAVKQVITDNPKVAATVVKNWVGDE